MGVRRIGCYLLVSLIYLSACYSAHSGTGVKPAEKPGAKVLAEFPILYTHPLPGFQLRLPPSWKRFRVCQKTTIWPLGIKAITVYFCLPTRDKSWSGEVSGYANLFALTFFSSDQYRRLKDLQAKGKGDVYEEIVSFAHNRQYHVHYSTGQACPSDLEARMAEAGRIVETFRFQKGK